ncbi:MAG: aminodeoxychorismate/anthranilate synthase component II [Burkholderiales bacterium]|nr:aminodeoxychorismate/anthranilate synthase component II [Burkholderiales bacterium]
MILIIDNFDSFVFNLSRYIENAGYETIVVRNNIITIEQIKAINPTHIIISPGPCTPNQAGISLDIIHNFYQQIPILGVCLGHQVIGQYFGARVTNAKHPMHGKSSIIIHRQSYLFNNIPNQLKVGRYHSLIVDDVADNLDIKIIAVSSDMEVMAVEHKYYPVYGVQFHPESILTEYGMQIIQNFVAMNVGVLL